MRTAVATTLLLLLATPGMAWSETAAHEPAERDAAAAPPAAMADRNEARWAEWEADARIADGDYEGAVQAEAQARIDRRRADREDLSAGTLGR
ncbi:MAG TPA: hypothetical protein PLD10_16715 [Rhodopila sp.]|nr:hypothetical protein [Rhodopila sp.]